MVVIQSFMTGSGKHAQAILRALPKWFGIEEATQRYINFANENLTFTATINEQVVGFLSIEQHSPQAAEIYAMGVLPEYHRQGIGHALLQATEKYLRDNGVVFLQVKTLSDKHPDVGYAKTRQFYYGVGFVPLEEFPELWGKHNPCLQMIKAI